MSPRPNKKRLGKKHRQASTRPKKGRAPRSSPSTGAVSPRQRKTLAAKRAEQEKKRRTPTRSPQREAHHPIAPEAPARRRPGIRPSSDPPPGSIDATFRPLVGALPSAGGPGRGDESAEEALAWDRAEQLATQMDAGPQRTTDNEERTTALPLIAICGRPNVGKSTLFNRLTGSRRSIVGDEPGITRDRIYGLIDWQSRSARLVDTGGVIPDDPALIPAEIFRQAQAALAEADAIVMVVDGRTELASPDLALARLLLRSGKPVFLAVNKIDTAALAPAAENFRTLGFANVIPISAEHGSGIGDLLDAVFAALPEAPEVAAPEAFLTESDEFDEDSTGPDFTPPPGSFVAAAKDPVILSGAKNPHISSSNLASREGVILTPQESESPSLPSTDNGQLTSDNSLDPVRPRRLRSHGSHVSIETRVAIIGRPNVGKSTLLNALTGSDRAIVSPIAGTTRDAVDEVVIRASHQFRFVDTAGIRRKGKTRLMAEKLSVVMARKHLEAADVSLLVLDATEGVTALDATIGGYAHSSGRSVVIVINKWDLMSHPRQGESNSQGRSGGSSGLQPAQSRHRMGGASAPESKPADKTIYEQQLRDRLKFLDYAPIVFLSAATGKGIDALFKKIELVARERRKRVSTGQINRFLARLDFQRAPVPLARRVKIYYMTQAAVAPPTFVLFTDKDVKLHFAFERFLSNQIRAAFGFIGAPIWLKSRPRNKKKPEE